MIVITTEIGRPSSSTAIGNPQLFSSLRSGLRCGDCSFLRRHYSIMRRRFVCDARRVALGLLQSFVQVCNLARQCVDLLPLRGNGLVERLDRLVLKRQPRLQSVNAIAECLLVTHRKPVQSVAHATHDRARHGRQRQSIRRASGSAPPARLPDISGCRP